MIIDITSKQLGLEYKSSDLLYFASTKEGFGLPILEAQSLVIPVITSNTTAMPFVAGEGALIIDPYSVDSIRDGLLLFIDKK
jgi:glycosyltransferase involved in cell wall biosynthesis